MILGIGTDLCLISDIQRRLKARGRSYLEQYCGESEVTGVFNSMYPEETASLILASKEAFGKALGTGYTTDFWWDDIEIAVVGNREARVHLNLQANALLRCGFTGLPRDRVHLATSLREDICSAFVVIERL